MITFFYSISALLLGALAGVVILALLGCKYYIKHLIDMIKRCISKLLE